MYYAVFSEGGYYIYYVRGVDTIFTMYNNSILMIWTLDFEMDSERFIASKAEGLKSINGTMIYIS